jgi:hypothetical protein
MYTTPPVGLEGRPEYHMSQLRSFAMTDTPDTCRDGLRAYRNARDWCKEQRNEAISQANERANPMEAEAPSGDLATGPALSFVTAVSKTEVYTVGQGQDFWILDEKSNTPRNSEELKRSVEIIPELTRSRRKRRNQTNA